MTEQRSTRLESEDGEVIVVLRRDRDGRYWAVWRNLHLLGDEYFRPVYLVPDSGQTAEQVLQEWEQGQSDGN